MSGSVTPTEVKDARENNGHIAVIDIREIKNYVDGHIKHSTHVPRRDLEFRLPIVVPNPHATVVLCDRTGDRASLDAEWLTHLGYTDVHFIAGGMTAWEDAGFEVIAAEDEVYSTALNYPSKDFGEKVHVEEGIDQITPDELKTLLDSDGDEVLVADVRTPEEHAWKTIPGALNIEGVDLGVYIGQLRDPEQPVVVHCTGRTRSIIGTASLKKLGYDNVYELENGTMGWELAGYDVEEDADRHVTDVSVDDDAQSRIRSNARALLEENEIPVITIDSFKSLRAGEDGVVYAVDVRKHEEYETGHIPGTVSIPGGQAIQTAVDHFGVRTGTIVFISNQDVRSAITAYWFSEMGYPNVAVLDGGVRSWEAQGRELETGPGKQPPLANARVADEVSTISPGDLVELQGTATVEIIDVSTSAAFAENHIEGAIWVPRYELEPWLEARHQQSTGTVVLTAKDELVAVYAAAAVREVLGWEQVQVLDGGLDEWRDAALPLSDDTDGMEFEPRDEIPRSASRQDDRAKQKYLAWEAALGEKYT